MKPITIARSLFVILLICLVFQSGNKCLAQKLTVDPNLAPKKQISEDPFESDKRLDQKVLYKANCKAVRDILADLEKMTEVKLHAGYNLKDWQVRDRRMNIFAADVSLRDLMRSISRVMKFKWSVGSDKELKTYRLVMDRRYLLEVQKLLKDQEEVFRQQMAERREDVISRYVDADKLSQEDIAQIRESDPQLYYDVIIGMAAPLARFLREIPQFKTTLLNGGRSVLLASDLPQSARESLKDLIKAYHTSQQTRVKIGEYPSAEAAPSDIDSLIDHLKIDVQTYDKVEDNPELSLYLASIIVITNEDGKNRMSDYNYCMGLVIPDNDAEIQRQDASVKIKAIEENQSMWNFVSQQTLQDWQNSWTKLRRSFPGEPAPERADDPSLDARVKVITDKKQLADIEQVLSESTKYSVVADSFYLKDTVESIPKEEMALRNVLDWIEEHYQYNWDKHGAAIELRDKQWFRKRSLQLPDEWLDRWRKELVDTHTITIEGISQLANISPEQLLANIHNDEILKIIDVSFIAKNRDILKAYAVLTPSERSQAFAKEGLSLRDLNQEQKMSVLYPMSEWFKKGRSTFTGEGKTLFIKSTKKGNVIEYAFSAVADDPSLETLDWQFTTPEYNKSVKANSSKQTKQ